MLPKYTASPVFAAVTVILLVAATGRSTEGTNKKPGGAEVGSDLPTLGVTLPKASEGGTWRLSSSAGEKQDGWAEETWSWEVPGEENNYSIKVEYKKQVPPPPAAEVARAFGRAASRASYASSVSDRAIDDRQQWVEYSLPLDGETGYKKIVTVADGYLTLTLARGGHGLPASGSPEDGAWKSMVECLRGAKVDR